MKKLIIFCLVVLAVGLLQECKPPNKVVNWTPTFDSQSKIPFGTYICENQLKYLFPDSPIHSVGFNTEEFLEEGKMRRSNFIFIYPEINVNYALESAIKDQRDHSNIFFLSAYNFNNVSKYDIAISDEEENIVDTVQTTEVVPPAVEPVQDSLLSTDSLPIATLPYFNGNEYKNLAKNKKLRQFEFLDSFYSGKKFLVRGSVKGKYFTELPYDAEVMGYVMINGEYKPNFIRIPSGTNWMYLHLEPMVFTNFSMKYNTNRSYVAAVFSHLPDKIIYWNNERIVARFKQAKSKGGIASFLSFALQHKGLKMGILILGLSGLLYILFNSTRRQKAIAYIPALKNDLLNYSDSLSAIFKKSPNYKYLCSLKVQYFRTLLNEHYGMQKIQFNSEFAQQLHQYSKIDLEECKYLIRYIEKVNQMDFCTETNFTELSSLLNQFYLKTQWYGKSRHKS